MVKEVKSMTAANQNAIENGNTVLGIEFGSTRIKAVLLDKENKTIATGSYSWENSYIDDIWTYSLDEIWEGLQVSYKNLVKKVKEIYGVEITRIASIGFSAMMHGYLAFDEDDSLLVPFRTWRNNITEEASEKLTKLFEYPIPQRWSIAHLYQSILNGEEHVSKLKYMTTLAGYVHWKLSGEKVLGVGDASGMFPIDIKTASFNKQMFNQFDKLVESHDPTGTLEAGSLMCPPEGDAETGMVATNSVAPRTGNVSAGTSVFAMVVLEDELSKPHPELDLVMTPTGKLVAMAHSNNCSSNLDRWINIFKEAVEELGFEVEINNLYETLYNKALAGDKDCGGLLAYGYLSGEHITGFEEGRPLFTMESNNNFNLANFMRVNLQSALGAMKIGMDILLKEEGVKLDKMLGHGGLFKTEGIALLASYHLNREENQTLEDFLNQYIFTGQSEQVIKPDPEDVQGFEEFMKRYKAGLSIERAAVENLN
jgi:sugar (pentulose or hexulose) kinase